MRFNWRIGYNFLQRTGTNVKENGREFFGAHTVRFSTLKPRTLCVSIHYGIPPAYLEYGLSVFYTGPYLVWQPNTH